MKNVFLAGILCLFSSAALAHSGIETSEPASGATLGDAPTQIVMVFYNDIRLTKVDIVHGSEDPVSLDVSNETEFATDFSLPVEGIDAGSYRIEWRGLGADGHPMQGEFTFEVE